MVGRHARIYMGRMADGDSVFVNGRLVGTTSYFGPPRKYDIPAGVLVQGKNNVTLKLTAMNGHGEIVPDKPYVIKEMRTPCRSAVLGSIKQASTGPVWKNTLNVFGSKNGGLRTV